MNYIFYRSMNKLSRIPGLLQLLLMTVFLVGCSSSRTRGFEKKVTRELQINKFGEHFTGLMVLDPSSGDTLVSVNSDLYFTPASNTKIFTLYTAVKILDDSIPALKYFVSGDTLIFSGTGNPSILHPNFRDSSAVNFLSRYSELVYVPGDFPEGRYGPGWAWEDYDSSFSPERSSFPLYGNVVSVTQQGGLRTEPNLFADSVQVMVKNRRREEKRNTFYFDPSRTDTLEIPYITSDRLTLTLLENVLGKSIRIGEAFPVEKTRTIMGSTPADSLYRRLMQESDNFIAEQLLMVSSFVLSDTISSSLARDFVLDSYLSEMEYKPRWVDGSGLSRYNLFTPSSMVYVLKKLLDEKGREWLFSVFPSGGKNGTLEEWYTGNPHPYVFAKSGTLGNTYCLSGFLIARSGKILIFSFMNNHYLEPASRIKARIQAVLEGIRDNY
ncbi:D-alanyl-D-alanine carboxypeptidase [Muriicola marianensis]|uniref:Peptidase M15 n=1 Tax=Muriicola marianensis TaxID=1324801 RepID=A0ABQ1R7B0_9FLAO|nr:D-alanyl-D-alanine carboxypeptidase [Muriicola marianensis]GGD58553.1 peptidase M15 [Muriicola marianensis]